MPLCPQITNTPTVLPRQVAITAVSYTSTTATYTASGHTFIAGDVVVITGLLPAGYNGTFTISSVSGSTTFTVPNTTNATVTDQSGLATPGGNYVVASILPVVPATTTQVNTAQATATTALSNAAIAYNAAVGSLQPSASTIVNASNQMTAIAANGITVYSGASATSGARVVMNSVGLAGYNSAGTATFSITASTGAAVFSGSITGSAITGSTLNINGNAIIDASGFLTASGATVTGTINATSGYIGSPTTGWNFSSSGYFYNSGSTTILYPSTSPGGNANTYSFYTDRGIYADKVYLTNTTAAALYSSGGLYALGALNVAASSGTALFAVNTSGAITAVAGITATGAITTSGNISTSGSGTITGAGNITASAYLINSGIAIQNGTAVHILTGGRLVQSTSSERFKKNIVSIPEGGWLDKVTQIRPVNFQYDEAYSEAPDEVISGLIAEDIAEIPGFEHLIYNDPLGDPFSLSYERLTVFLVMAIKELKAEIDQLKGE